MKKLLISSLLPLCINACVESHVSDVPRRAKMPYREVHTRVLNPDVHFDASTNDFANVAPASPCPNDMVFVEGNYCPEVRQNCLRWADDYSGNQLELRCFEFSPSTCLSAQRVHMRFCMDRYEYPNRAGVNPQVMMTWFEARQFCENQGRRLCTSNEWEFACEGEQMNPYPYGDGLHRDSTACRIDHQTVLYNAGRLANPTTRDDELRRSYEAVPSGQMQRCVSWAGVHDMTGNVDEWVVNTHSQNMERAPYHSGLKGGWWGPVRTRCRPMTVSHGPSFSYYQIGTRCCLNP